jgi:phenylalanyl-tRNA synthetase alpha chain
MKEALEQIRLKAREALEAAGDAKTLEDLRVRFLGKKGELTAILKQMGGLSDEERPVIGQLANQIRTEIENEIKSADAHVKEKMLEEKLAAETVDVTLPGTPCPTGKLHPLNKVLEEFERIFIGMGFSVVTGPEVETDYYNFEALNIPKDHPRATRRIPFISTRISCSVPRLGHAGPHDGKNAPADPHHLPRPRLSLRRPRRHPISRCFIRLRAWSSTRASRCPI